MVKTVVITGGTGGLGRSLAKRLLVQEDVRLAVGYLLPEEASAFEDALDFDEDRVMLRRVDAGNSGAVAAFVEEAAAGLGPIHGLAALVGGWAGGRDIEDTDDVRFERMMDLNLKSSFIAVRAAIPFLKQSEYGRIVLVGSRAGIENPPGQAAFNMAKAAVMALGRSVAAEMDGSEVTATVLVPNLIDTPATRSALPYAEYVEWPTPDEIAAIAEFLLSREAGVLNGAMIPVFGRT